MTVKFSDIYKTATSAAENLTQTEAVVNAARDAALNAVAEVYGTPPAPSEVTSFANNFDF